MSTDQPEPKIELEVKNFGPIAEAKIDLRPLTVFVGPNNTGKSYLATLLYALHQAFETSEHYDSDSTSSLFAETLQPVLHEHDLDEIGKWIASDLRAALSDETSKVVPSPPDRLEVVVRETLCGNSETKRVIIGQLGRYFGISEDPAQIVRHGAEQGAEVIVRCTPDQDDDTPYPLEYRFVISDKAVNLLATVAWRYGHTSIRRSVKATSTLRHMRSLERMLKLTIDSELRRSAAFDRVRTLAHSALRSCLGSLERPAYYLPADRTGVMHANNAVVAAMISSASYAGFFRRDSDVVLPGVLADFMRDLVLDMGESSHGESDIASEIETGILGGSAHRRLSEGGHPRFTYQPQGWKGELPLSRVSSMVSELAPIVLYLKHLVEPGETIIIDEPESHLHPAAQTEFATSLARLVRSGVRVILTTHSNWFVDQFANLVRLSDLGMEETADLDGSDAALRSEDVGVWSFEQQPEGAGTIVKEIQFDRAGVGYDPGYLEVAEAQYRTWVKVGNRLADKSQT